MPDYIAETPSSIIGGATERIARVGASIKLLRKVVGLELADAALDPSTLTPERQAEYRLFIEETAATIRQQFDLLTDVIKTTGIGLGEGGIAELLRAPDDGRALTPGAPQPVNPAAVDGKKGGREAQANPDLSVTVNIEGTDFTTQALRLTSAYEVEILRLLPDVGDQPFARGKIFDIGFQSDADPKKRGNNFTRGIYIVEKLKLVAGGRTVIGKISEGPGTEYIIELPFAVDGKEVVVTDPSFQKKSS